MKSLRADLSQGKLLAFGAGTFFHHFANLKYKK